MHARNVAALFFELLLVAPLRQNENEEGSRLGWPTWRIEVPVHTVYMYFYTILHDIY